MLKPKIISKIILGIFLILVSFKPCFALDDGFTSVGKIESKYFTLYYAPELKPAKSNNEQLNGVRKEQVLVTTEQPVSANPAFSEMLDTLFLHVSDLLDIRLDNFQGIIKVCKDYASLNDLYKQICGSDLENQNSFYVKDLNTIYISVKSFNRETIGREMVYAILSQYFQVQTPIRVQNVLAGYVESQLKDNSQ